MVGVLFLNFFDNEPGKNLRGLQIIPSDGLYRFSDGVLDFFRPKINYLPIPLYYFGNHI